MPRENGSFSLIFLAFLAKFKSWEIETKLQEKSALKNWPCLCFAPRVWMLLDLKSDLWSGPILAVLMHSLLRSLAECYLQTKRNENRTWSQVRFEVILGRKLKEKSERRKRLCRKLQSLMVCRSSRDLDESDKFHILY